MTGPFTVWISPVADPKHGAFFPTRSGLRNDQPLPRCAILKGEFTGKGNPVAVYYPIFRRDGPKEFYP